MGEFYLFHFKFTVSELICWELCSLLAFIVNWRRNLSRNWGNSNADCFMGWCCLWDFDVSC